MENNDSMSFQSLDALRDKIKSFWSRKEGMLAMGVLAIPTVLIILNANKILAWLIVLFENLIIGSLLGIVAGVILSIILGCIIMPGPRNAIIMSFKGLMTRITRAFTKNFAMEIVIEFRDWTRGLIDQLDNSILALKKNIASLKSKMDANTRDAERNYELAEAEEKLDPNSAMISTYSANAQEWENLNRDYGQMVIQFNELLEYAKEYQKMANVKYQRLSNKVDVLQARKETMGSAVSTFKTLRSVIIGDGSKDVIYADAVGFLNKEYTDGLSEIEHFLDSSSDFRHEMKLESIVQSKEGLDAFAKWKNTKSTVRLGSSAEQAAPSRAKGVELKSNFFNN